MTKMADAELFRSHAPRLFAIAYRMLGSASDAEDVLQDAWLRLSRVDPHEVRSPRALATTIVTRLCLDRLKSARAAREEYVGPWLPEPVLTDEARPDTLAERSESVTLAFLLLLETLSPEERAVFLLKEVFDYEHAEIADTLGTTAANSRQLLHRAKEKLAAAGPARRMPDAQATRRRRHLAERFAAAFATGDASTFATLLADDVTFVSDGGGKAPAARRPIAGRETVTGFLVGIRRSAAALGLVDQAALEAVEVNGEPAVVVRVGGRLDSVYVLSPADDAIASISVVRNPGKLAYIDRQLTAPRG